MKNGPRVPKRTLGCTGKRVDYVSTGAKQDLPLSCQFRHRGAFLGVKVHSFNARVGWMAASLMLQPMWCAARWTWDRCGSRGVNPLRTA